MHFANHISRTLQNVRSYILSVFYTRQIYTLYARTGETIHLRPASCGGIHNAKLMLAPCPSNYKNLPYLLVLITSGSKSPRSFTVDLGTEVIIETLLINIFTRHHYILEDLVASVIRSLQSLSPLRVYCGQFYELIRIIRLRLGPNIHGIRHRFGNTALPVRFRGIDNGFF